MTIQVLIVDDHAVLRAGLGLLINSQPDMTVTGEAEDGDEALRLAKELHPTVVLLDLSMPKAGGLAVLKALRQQCPHTGVVILSMYMDPAYIRAALEAGALGYVTKMAAHAEVLNAVRAVAGGETYLCPVCRESLVQAALFPRAKGWSPKEQSLKNPLSAREREVLILVARGHTNRVIAERLRLSVKSVETYRARVMEKLGLRSRAELVRYAMASGLLEKNLEEPELPS